MNIGLEGIFFLWVGLFKILFIPMLLIPGLLVPLFFLVKRRFINRKARFFILSFLFSYLTVIIISIISVYCPIHTIARYIILWLFELSVCFYLILVIFRRQHKDQRAKGVFSNKNIAFGIALIFAILVPSEWAIDFYIGNGSFKVEGNILIVDIKKPITDTRKILSYLNRKTNSGSIILIQLNSGGGLTREILNLSNTLFELDNRTCCYIKGSCFRSAVFIALSCNEIIMQEGSKIGNMGPIRLPETELGEGLDKISVEDRINNELKQTSKHFSNNKYNSHVILGMFGENNGELTNINSSFSKISEDNPLVLSSETAFNLNISQKTIKEFSDVLEFLRKE